jgi:hypothetical protein
MGVRVRARTMLFPIVVNEECSGEAGFAIGLTARSAIGAGRSARRQVENSPCRFSVSPSHAIISASWRTIPDPAWVSAAKLMHGGPQFRAASQLRDQSAGDKVRRALTNDSPH